MESDLQSKLQKAFNERNFSEFTCLINQGAKPNLSSEQDENDLSIYEQALATPSACEFVHVCLKSGCDVNYVNSKINKAAINFAADSRDSDNLEQLLNNDVRNLDYQYQNETALLTLCKNIKPENFTNVYWCIRMLLNSDASPNIADQENRSPLHHILMKESISRRNRLLLLYHFMINPKLSLQSYNDGVHYVLQQPPNGQYPYIYYILLRKLASLNAEDLVNTLMQYSKSITDWNHRTMQKILFIKYKKDNEMKYLSAVVAIMDINTQQDNQKLVEKVIKDANWKTVELLLKSKLMEKEVRSVLLKKMINKAYSLPILSQKDKDYQSCLNLLLKQHAEYLNDLDAARNPLLYYAIQYHNEIAICAMLRQGARLVVQSAKNNVNTIRYIGAQCLEKHFDDCITAQESPSHENYEVTMNFMNLRNQWNKLDMAPILYMANSKELCHLLQHPLITCFLLLKWRHLSNIFYTHFAINILFAILLTAHALIRFPTPIECDACALGVKCVCWIMIVYMLLIDLLSFLLFKKLPTLLDLSLIISIILTCIELDISANNQRFIAVSSVMLMIVKLISFISDLTVAAISTHMLMWRQVCRTFLISFAQLSINLFDYAFGFYILFANTEEDTNFLTFSLPNIAFLKTLVMFHSECDIEIDFSGYQTSCCLLLFMFINKILGNLLGGLAVKDTQTIRSQVKLNAAICRTYLLHRYEFALSENWGMFEMLRRIGKKVLNLKFNSPSDNLSIFPNQDNMATYARIKEGPADSNFKTAKMVKIDMSIEELMQSNKCLQNSDAKKVAKKWTVDNETVKSVLNIIRQKSDKKIQKQFEENVEKRFEDLRISLEDFKDELRAMISPKLTS